MSLSLALGLWVALSFVASPLIGAMMYRQSHAGVGMAPARKSPAAGMAPGNMVGAPIPVPMRRPAIALSRGRYQAGSFGFAAPTGPQLH